MDRLRTFEPALLRAILTALAVVLGTVGLDASGVFERVDVAWTALFAVFPLVQGWWTRRAVTPNAVVVERVEAKSEGEPDVVVAGEANERIGTGDFVRDWGTRDDLDEV